jgi:hypothetical protein
MKAKPSGAKVQVLPIARIEQDRLLRILIVEWILREEKEKLRKDLLAGRTIAPGSLTVKIHGKSILIESDVSRPTA